MHERQHRSKVGPERHRSARDGQAPVRPEAGGPQSWRDRAARHASAGDQADPAAEADRVALHPARADPAPPAGGDIASMEWAVDVSGEPVPLGAYPHRQTKRGTSVEVNRGKRTLLKGAFVATLRSGHEGVFRRRGASRLPIDELLGSRPVDALLHEGEAEAVAERGGKSFGDTFVRVLPLEVGK